MGRKKIRGLFVLSAGEIGSFTVCPEAWRLRQTTPSSTIHPSSVQAGEKLHREWVKNYDESEHMSRHARRLVALLIAVTAIYIVTRL